MLAKVLLSKEKLLELKNELKELIDVKRPNIIKLLQDARSQGDLSENADYDAAKNEQSIIEGRIDEINSILNNYELMKEHNKGSNVKIGSEVTIYDMKSKEEDTYEIVGQIEANPSKNKISYHCPLAKSILGFSEGDVILIQGVETPYKVKIIKIKN
jgi:transcription elongation factor GreA